MIPDPPLISYAKDVAKLNRVWDDTSPFWSPMEVPFQIQEVPVALMYWKDLYAYGKTGHWKGTKSKWADWKVLLAPFCGHATVFVDGFSFFQTVVDRYRQSTIEDFWAEFSEGGKRLCFTAIVSRLREQRKARDEEVAAQAAREYGSITYRQGSRHAVAMCKPYAIAKAYRACHEAA